MSGRSEGTAAGAYRDICAGGGNALDGTSDPSYIKLSFFPGPLVNQKKGSRRWMYPRRSEIRIVGLNAAMKSSGFGCDMAQVGERVVGVFGIDKGQEMNHEIAKAKVLNGIRQRTLSGRPLLLTAPRKHWKGSDINTNNSALKAVTACLEYKILHCF